MKTSCALQKMQKPAKRSVSRCPAIRLSHMKPAKTKCIWSITKQTAHGSWSTATERMLPYTPTPSTRSLQTLWASIAPKYRTKWQKQVTSNPAPTATLTRFAPSRSCSLSTGISESAIQTPPLCLRTKGIGIRLRINTRIRFTAILTGYREAAKSCIGIKHTIWMLPQNTVHLVRPITSRLSEACMIMQAVQQPLIRQCHILLLIMTDRHIRSKMLKFTAMRNVLVFLALRSVQRLKMWSYTRMKAM